MRVSSQVTLGSFLLILVLIGVPWFSMTQLRKFVDQQRELIQVEIQAAVITLEQERLVPQLESTARKIFVTDDPDYADRVEELSRRFQTWMERLQALELSERVRGETNELDRLWQEFPFEERAREVLERGLDPDEQQLLDGALRDQMLAIRKQLNRVTEATQEGFEARAAESLERSRQAETVAWAIVVAALVGAIPFVWATVRSIREPLRSLEESTRSVASGIYSYQLDTTGSDEFSKLALSFNDMVARLGELDQMKRDFLSHVSHELKTPLVAMDETNRLMLDELPGPLNEKQRKFLELNLAGSQRLAGMISKLLDLARMEERAVLFELQTNDLVELCSRVADSFLAKTGEMGVPIELEAVERPVLAECDRDRIVQLVGNLVDNALKHSPSSSSVTVRVRPPDKTGRARIEVVDSGPGVPDDQKSRIFEKFHQVGRPMTGGVGLGLAICREIVDAHQGEIWVEDNEGGGSVFIVALQSAAEGRKAQVG